MSNRVLYHIFVQTMVLDTNREKTIDVSTCSVNPIQTWYGLRYNLYLNACLKIILTYHKYFIRLSELDPKGLDFFLLVMSWIKNHRSNHREKISTMTIIF
jgi:hypothetical protein